jgi:hypothetical protein
MMSEAEQQRADLAPRNGESLAVWVNRLRPKGAPRIFGLPVWRDGLCLVWRAEGWTVCLGCGLDKEGLAGWPLSWEPPGPAQTFDLTADGDRETGGHEWEPAEAW